MTFMRRWCRRDVECLNFNKGRIPKGNFPWLVISEKLGAQVVVDVEGFEVACKITDLVSDAVQTWGYPRSEAGRGEDGDDLLRLAEALEDAAATFRRHHAKVNA